MENKMEYIILFLQAIILVGQLALSYKMYCDSHASPRGYFLLTNDNIGIPEKIKKRLTYVFDLSKPIIFHNNGDDNLILNSCLVEVNNKVVSPGNNVSNAFFTNTGDDLSQFYVELNLTENDLKQPHVHIEISFKLTNMKKYKYSQKFFLDFEKDNDMQAWRVSKINIEFK